MLAVGVFRFIDIFYTFVGFVIIGAVLDCYTNRLADKVLTHFINACIRFSCRELCSLGKCHYLCEGKSFYLHISIGRLFFLPNGMKDVSVSKFLRNIVSDNKAHIKIWFTL